MTLAWMEQNAADEQDCLEQAARELGAITRDCGLVYIRKVLARAQEIKLARKGAANGPQVQDVSTKL
jgi:hypothetical protein